MQRVADFDLPGAACNPGARRHAQTSRPERRVVCVWYDLCCFHRPPKNAERHQREASSVLFVQQHFGIGEKCCALGCHAGRINQGGCFAYLKFDNLSERAQKSAWPKRRRNVSGLNGILGPPARTESSNNICIHSRGGERAVTNKGFCTKGRPRERENYITSLSCSLALCVRGCAQNKCVIALSSNNKIILYNAFDAISRCAH